MQTNLKLAVWILAPALAGCSAIPRQEDVTRLSTYDIVTHVRCEAQRGVVRYPYYKTASIAYEFTFDVTENNNASGDVTFKIPFVEGGSFSLFANAGSNRVGNTKRNFKIVDSFDELLQVKCSDQDRERNWLYPISGHIGAYEVVTTFIRLQQVDNQKAGEVFTFADNLKFTTTFFGGIKPQLVLNPVTDRFRVVSANADVNASRVDFHEVKLTLAGAPPRSTMPLGRSIARGGFVVPAGANSALVSTTILQTVANPKDRALLELDRQRIIDLQDRSRNLLVGP
jgi:hypothetical protein